MKAELEENTPVITSNIIWVGDIENGCGVFAINLDNVLYIKKEKILYDGKTEEKIVMVLIGDKNITMDVNLFNKYIKPVVR